MLNLIIKNTRMKKYQYIAIALGAVLFASCEDMLTTHYEGGTQDDDYIQATVEANPERVNSAVSGMYQVIKQPLGYFGSSNRADDCGYVACALGQDLNSADMTNIVSGYDWFSVAQEWSDRNPSYANPTLRLGLFYKLIYATNEVIAMVPDDTDNAKLMASRGQAKALRAFAYLSLAPYFQFNYADNKDKESVPMIIPGQDASNNPRVTLEVLYESILQDLSDAIEDLNGYTRENKGIIDQQVAYGLRARAYLNMEMWEEAAADADAALVGYEPYSLSEVEANPMFCNADDHNWMWALLLPMELTESSGYASLATWPSQLSSFSANGYVAFAGIYRSINNLLWNKISETDVRRAWWLDENLYSPYLEGLSWTDEANAITYTGKDIPAATIADVKQPMPVYTNVKFMGKSGCGGAYNDGDWCMMRAEEMLLIKAEAAYKAGNTAVGEATLKKLMDQRDPSWKQTCMTFEDEVWLQRRIELWGEGFAMSDIMRLKKNVVRYHEGDENSNVAEPYRFNIQYGDPWMLLRFVQGELTNNRGCSQNEGGELPEQGDGAGLTDGVTD